MNNFFSDDTLEGLDENLLDDKGKGTPSGDEPNSQGEKLEVSAEDAQLLKDAKTLSPVIKALKENPELINVMRNELGKKEDGNTPPNGFDINKALTDKNSKDNQYLGNVLGEIVGQAIDQRETLNKKTDSLAKQVDVMKTTYGYDDAKIASLIDLSKQKELTLEDLHLSMNKGDIVNEIIDNMTVEKLGQMKDARKLSLANSDGETKNLSPSDVIFNSVEKALGSNSRDENNLDITEFDLSNI